MAQSLTSLWLKNIARIGKAQRAQGRKLLTSLMPKPARRAKAVKATQGLKLTPAKTAKPPRKSSAEPARPICPWPGVWKKSHFTVPADGQLAPARRMAYWLYLPASASATTRPLVVMLHGCQQTAPDFALSTKMNQLAERKGFAVLYPQQSAAADRHRCWHWYKRATQQGEGDIALMAGMIAQVQVKHRLDKSRTYVAGLSAGAGLATILALRHPELIAAVGLHSAPVFGTSDSPLGAFRAMQQGSGRSYRETAHSFASALPQFPGMPAILIHGARDPVVRHINATQLTEQFAIINAPAITRPEPVSRSYAARTGGRSPRHGYQTETYYAGQKPLLLRCEINSLGHAWSGGDGSLAFTAPEGPDATLMMWTFFARHQRTAKP
ncbi:PHB depolymerase family esterase [Polaromonas sp.]|uniref:extracellular catalytic domain type 1 short-chain-length polyhydroxyalkanoate depolymerase n=1 Tax=Polaromonas sp. TaxID=1869339 RepID=UPI001DD602E7|nr:PHB depolymerase family esterase [Polaromonas sp.]MBT9477076.1 PHB depolymerase family esterase [Polaromonas sp.]